MEVGGKPMWAVALDVAWEEENKPAARSSSEVPLAIKDKKA
jgi:hypothetical protein